MTFSAEELDAVTRWLTDRRDWLLREGLSVESRAIEIARDTAGEQLKELQDAEAITK